MSSIVFDGNTYTFGATVSANPGTGTTSYVFGGLSSGWTYGFIIWAFNGFGNSNIVGPSLISTSQSFIESRSPIISYLYNWENYMYSPTEYRFESGNTTNYLISTSNLSNTKFYTFTLSPSGFVTTNVEGGIEDPFGTTNGFRVGFTCSHPTNTSTIVFNSTIVEVPVGSTYTFSLYHNVSCGYTNLRWSLSGNITNSNQILPTETSSLLFSYPSGLSGWVRYAREFYVPIGADLLPANSESSPGMVPLNLSIFRSQGIPVGATGYIYVCCPQLEKST